MLSGSQSCIAQASLTYISCCVVPVYPVHSGENVALVTQHSFIKNSFNQVRQTSASVIMWKGFFVIIIWKWSFHIFITLNHTFCFTFADCDPDKTLITPVSSTQGIPMCTSRKPAPHHWTTHRPADYISSASKSLCWACSLDLSTI